MEERFITPAFPRSSAYNPDWILGGVSGGANPLWMTEWLTMAMELRPGMKVLDLGCGRALSSIFLHREYGVQVWATDLWFSAAENLQRIRDAGATEMVFPIHADARSLPYAEEFFDAIISIDSFPYYGTDDTYLNYLARFVKPGGQIGIAGAGLIKEFSEEVPDHLRDWWTPDMGCLHSADWWRHHWQRTGIMVIECADSLPDGWRLWQDWILAVAPDNAGEIQALEVDGGRYLGYVRMLGRRQTGIQLIEPFPSIPADYRVNPVLR